MLRKFLSRFSHSCIKRQDEVDEPDQPNIENENNTRAKGYSAERPKSRQIPIPSTRSWASGGNSHTDNFTRDYEANANIRANRNKCRQSGGDIKMARISRQDLMDVDEGFQFGSKAERNEETPARKDEATDRSLGTAGNSALRCASGRVSLPRNCVIKIGSIVESADGSLPRITVAENPSERMIFQLADVGSTTMLRSTNLRETGIYYNTNSGTVELHGGMLQNDYTI